MVTQDVCEDMGANSAWSKMLMCWTAQVDQWGAENCNLMQCAMRWLKRSAAFGSVSVSDVLFASYSRLRGLVNRCLMSATVRQNCTFC